MKDSSVYVTLINVARIDSNAHQYGNITIMDATCPIKFPSSHRQMHNDKYPRLPAYRFTLLILLLHATMVTVIERSFPRVPLWFTSFLQRDCLWTVVNNRPELVSRCNEMKQTVMASFSHSKIIFVASNRSLFIRSHLFEFYRSKNR